MPSDNLIGGTCVEKDALEMFLRLIADVLENPMYFTPADQRFCVSMSFDIDTAGDGPYYVSVFVKNWFARIDARLWDLAHELAN